MVGFDVSNRQKAVMGFIQAAFYFYSDEFIVSFNDKVDFSAGASAVKARFRSPGQGAQDIFDNESFPAIAHYWMPAQGCEILNSEKVVHKTSTKDRREGW